MTFTTHKNCMVYMVRAGETKAYSAQKKLVLLRFSHVEWRT
jgi:hypothetical protein